LLLASIENIEIWFIILIQSYSSTLLKDTSYIEEFYISKDYRSQWYWSLFFSYLTDYAKQNNISRIEWSTHTTNESAKNFYSKYGVDDKWIFYKMNMD
jgi:GNAT superfamily N-acetyltransferase